MELVFMLNYEEKMENLLKEIEELQSKLLKEQKQVAALEASVQNLKSENSEISRIKKELEEIKKVLGMEASLKNKK